DMHIILDGVFNHVSDDSVYFDRYYKFLGQSEKIGAYPYWAYVYDAMAEQGMTQADAEAAAKVFFGENYGITDYSYTEWFHVSSTPATWADNIGLRAGKPVYSYEGWWGYDSMPVIYSTNGSEYQTGNWAEEIISGDESVNAYWITKGMDGWRLDVANEVSDETWQNFRDSVKALDSDAVIIGEIWDDATKYLMGDMYDSVMNYLFRNAVVGFAKGNSASQTTRELEKIRERYPEEAFYAMMNLVGSHDTTRILSYLDGIGDDRNQKDFNSAFPTYEGTSQLAKDRQYLVAFLQFTYAGAPTIYYGDEIGMVGSDDPDDRRAFEWGKGNEELVNWYAKLAAIRAAYPALRTGDVKMLNTGNASLMGYYRDEILVISNNAASEKTYAVQGEYIDLVTGEAYTGTIPGLRGVILVPAEQAVQITVDTENLAPAWDPAYIVGAEQPEPEVQVVATGWSGYTTWVLTSDGTLTFSPTEERFNGKCNLANYHKVGGVLTLPWSAYAETITKVVIEEGINAVGQMAFYGLPNLKTVVLASTVEEVRNYAFKNVTSLTDINLENVMFIREGAFYGCSGLKDLTFMSGVTIEDWAFSYTDIIP
ncbi:MAG: leucine-rich repeat protein, partial [Oscillospiraceae bacterium]|nr:leucine-rich repeat protein [Oscillospiraceae bacterium]